MSGNPGDPKGSRTGQKLPTRKDKEKTDQCQDESLKENSEGQQARTREIGTTQTTSVSIMKKDTKENENPEGIKGKAI